MRGANEESNSNFLQLFKLRGEDDPRFLQWLQRKTNKYTSAEMQNEILKILSLQGLRKIASKLHEEPFYTIMVDETTDVTNREQVVICLRYVDDHFVAHEEFLGLYTVDNICSDTLAALIKDVLLRLNLSISKARGQCYDGASNMAGAKSGVAKQIRSEEPRAVFTHCYGHTLNLACGDVVKFSKMH